MKRVFLLVMVATMTATSVFAGGYGNSSSSAGDMRWGITTGINFAKQKMEEDGMDVSTDSKAGFKLGVVGEYYLSDMFFIAPELQFSMKGASMSGFGFDFEDDDDYYYYGSSSYGSSSSSSSKVKTNISYLQLPINVGAKYDINRDWRVSAFTGPYFALAVGGKDKVGSLKTDLNFGSSEEDDYKRFDFGWSFGAGVEYKSIFFKLHYELGLSNLDTSGDSLSKAKNRNFGLSVGYMFNIN